MRYNTAAQRVGIAKGAILAHAIHKEVLGITGDTQPMQKNMGTTLKMRRWLPYGGSATNATTINTISVTVEDHLAEDGSTPDADDLIPQDITVEMRQYACLYSYTDWMADMYEDDIPGPMREQVGERMGLLREMIRYGAMKQCSNRFYAGGTSQATVADRVTLGFMRAMSRSLQANRGSMISEFLEASANYNTAPIEASYLTFGHTDMEADFRDLEDFVPTSKYARRRMVHECELGSVERFRVVLSPELAPILAGGAAIGSTGLKSVGAANVDIYPTLVVGRNAWGDIALRGMTSFKITHIKPEQIDSSDPLGQRGYVGAKFPSAAKVLNDGWMALGYAGVTDL